MLRRWEDLPEFMRLPEVKPYWDVLDRKRGQLVIKRCFDIAGSIVLIGILGIPMFVIAISIKLDSPGAVLYQQERVTTYGKRFKIHKFRTMVANADSIGSAVTIEGDSRITKVGSRLRRMRFDEFPQLFDILTGNMSFVGTRPEVVKYVERYKPEYYATLLMPAGITSEASIRFKDEDKLLNNAEDVDTVYIDQVLPRKMRWNLDSISNFNFVRDIAVMFNTLFAMLRQCRE